MSKLSDELKKIIIDWDDGCGFVRVEGISNALASALIGKNLTREGDVFCTITDCHRDPYDTHYSLSLKVVAPQLTADVIKSQGSYRAKVDHTGICFSQMTWNELVEKAWKDKSIAFYESSELDMVACAAEMAEMLTNTGITVEKSDGTAFLFNDDFKRRLIDELKKSGVVEK